MLVEEVAELGRDLLLHEVVGKESIDLRQGSVTSPRGRTTVVDQQELLASTVSAMDATTGTAKSLLDLSRGRGCAAARRRSGGLRIAVRGNRYLERSGGSYPSETCGPWLPTKRDCALSARMIGFGISGGRCRCSRRSRRRASSRRHVGSRSPALIGPARFARCPRSGEVRRR